MSAKTLIIYGKEGNEVVIDNTPEQIKSWTEAGYSIDNPITTPSKPDEFVPVIMVKDGENEKIVKTQKAYDKAIEQGWVVKEVVKENEN